MSKVNNALLEIGCEEIPARFMNGLLDDLKKQAEEKLAAERIAFKKVATFGTYRRLVLYLEDVAERQADLAFEAKGPPANVAFDKEGQPTPAAIGFVKKQGLSLNDLKVENNYVVARVTKSGLPTNKVLQKVFPEIITSLYQPLAMRWGDGEFKFIRPIHWLVGLLGGSVVKFEVAGVKSGKRTASHPYHKSVGTGLVPVRLRGQPQGLSLHNYKQQLKKLGVIVDQNERQALIKKQVEAAAQKVKGQALIEADLLLEVTYLVENPIAYVGSFKADFLKIPQDVLITSMKKNQKYFPIMDKAGKLMPKFVVVTDGCKFAGVVAGNEKVLSARLSDARFFFEEDQKVSLKARVKDLEKVAFFEKLGTMADKTARILKLSEWLAARLTLQNSALELVQKIAKLCKADLTTKMVYEFPTLQGVMGREYALLSGESKSVANGIFEHYLPRFLADLLPASPESAVVALADRFDSLVGCFSVGAVPTGSTDPYGLRRAAHGIIRIIQEQKLDLLLDETIARSYKLYEPILDQATSRDLGTVQRQLLGFIAGRVKPVLLELNIRYDIIEAALANFNDILDVFEKAKVLNKIAAEKWFIGLVRSADRVSRIAKDAPFQEIGETQLVDQEEKALFDLYQKVNWEVGEAINVEAWPKALAALAKLTEPIELFFDKVLVMHQDEKIRANRLALLKTIEQLYLKVADFRKVVIAG